MKVIQGYSSADYTAPKFVYDNEMDETDDIAEAKKVNHRLMQMIQSNFTFIPDNKSIMNIVESHEEISRSLKTLIHPGKKKYNLRTEHVLYEIGKIKDARSPENKIECFYGINLENSLMIADVLKTHDMLQMNNFSIINFKISMKYIKTEGKEKILKKFNDTGSYFTISLHSLSNGSITRLSEDLTIKCGDLDTHSFSTIIPNKYKQGLCFMAFVIICLFIF